MGTRRSPRREIDYVKRILIISASVLLLVMLILPYFEKGTLFTVAGDLSKLFLTTYLAYMISAHFSRKAAREELRDLGMTTGRRIFLHSAQLRELSAEVLGYEADGDRSKIYYNIIASQLNKLASHAELSFEEVQQMAQLDISIPALVDEVRSKVVDDTRRECVKCPFCQHDTDVLIGQNPGATKHLTCANCHHHFAVYRLADHSLKLGYEDQSVINCPNGECQNRIKIKRGPADFGKVVRNCYECFARVTFDLDANAVEGWTREEPLSIDSKRILDSKAECPYCSWVVTFKETRNSKEQWVQYCPSCTKLMLVKES